jgi:hypothetical protein
MPSTEPDIVEALKSWRDQLYREAPLLRSQGQLPEIEIDLINRAIEEIERLRAGRRG